MTPARSNCNIHMTFRCSGSPIYCCYGHQDPHVLRADPATHRDYLSDYRGLHLPPSKNTTPSAIYNILVMERNPMPSRDD